MIKRRDDLDISNSDEGTFRVSRSNEHTYSASDIANLDECILVLDDAFPSITDRSTTATATGREVIRVTATAEK